MRIIGGRHRSRVLKSFPGTDIRPTSDRGREAFFNIFSSTIPGCAFYDGFAGTGAMGLEALSRGASTVVFTDVDRRSIDLIKANLDLLKEVGEVINVSAISYLGSTQMSFDIIFLDPPYKTDLGERALTVIDGRIDLLKEGGFVVYENEKAYSEGLENLEYVSSRRYGKNCLNIYRRK